MSEHLPASSNNSAGLVACAAGLMIAAWTLWQAPPADSPKTTHYKVDINSARWVELLDVEGIGDTLAMRIVENRKVEGPFESVDELTRVRGIGEKSLAKMRPAICVGKSRN